MSSRPSFIISTGELPENSHVYPQSEEAMGPVRRVGSVAGLVRLGINLQRLPRGNRIVYPLNPSRRADLKATDWRHDAPSRKLGDHDGRPDKLNT